MTIKVLSPTGVPPDGKIQVTPRVKSLNGKMIGFVDNGKPNFNIFVSRVEELLNQKYNLAGVMHVEKGHLGSATAVPPERMEELANSCDAVICGVGD